MMVVETMGSFAGTLPTRHAHRHIIKQKWKGCSAKHNRFDVLLLKLLLVLSPVLTTIGCSTLAPDHKDYSEVVYRQSNVPRGVYPVFISLVDGKPLPIGQQGKLLTLRSGPHTFRLAADLAQARESVPSVMSRRGATTKTFTLHLEPGCRYFLGAQVETLRPESWVPIVWRTETLSSSCDRLPSETESFF